MQVIADLHIHGPKSGGSSRNMNFENLALNAALKGVDIVTTSDFTQPEWTKEIKEKLEYSESSGLFKLKDRYIADKDKSKVKRTRFILGTEVNCTFDSPIEGEKRKKQIHHVLLARSLEITNQLTEELQRFGKLERLGRPSLHVSAAELVEIVKEIDQANLIFAAHIWTPHFSLFGANSGFNNPKDCYGNQLNKIDALETGLSSDPLMNWRVSSLDKFVLVSNSDAHSPSPWRLGREANQFELPRITYEELVEAIQHPSNGKFKQTIEFPPPLGKYHWTGHRKCAVCLAPTEALQLANHCPVCGKKLTIGVDQRVEELADRQSPIRPSGSPGFIFLVPLHNLLALALNITTLNSKKVNQMFVKMIKRFGSEYAVTLQASYTELQEITNEQIAKAIYAMRFGKYQIFPGSDNQYGQLNLYLNDVTGMETEKERKLPTIGNGTRGKQGDLAKYFRIS
ncbi:MAG: endonuclease Q family protein [Candidatus Heimdallarchaeota archaeon]